MGLRFLKKAAAAIYSCAYKAHHAIFLRPGKRLENARLVVVGSFLAGGAGKTPFCIWLAQFLKNEFVQNHGHEPSIAILCHSVAYDEVELLQKKAPFAKVLATANRYKTAQALDRDFDYIICDDGFEDSRLTGAAVIRLDWGDAPTTVDRLVPAGNCRSLLQWHRGPGAVLNSVTVLKCGQISNGDDVEFCISSIANAKGDTLPKGDSTNSASQKITAMCGIGNPTRFANDLANFGIAISQTIRRPDHDTKFAQHLSKALAANQPIVITEKDAARLPRALLQNPHLYTAHLETRVTEQVCQATANL